MAYERERAKERMSAGGEKAGRGRPIGSSQRVQPYETGRATERVAKQFGIGTNTQWRVSDAIERGVPELAGAIESGMSANEATQIANLNPTAGASSPQ